MYMIVPLNYTNQESSDSSNMLVGPFDSVDTATEWLRGKQYVGIVVGDELTFYFIPQGPTNLPKWMPLQCKLRRVVSPDIQEAPS